jgi:hypothetical protein
MGPRTRIAALFLGIAAQAGCADVRAVQPGLANVAAVPLSETTDVQDVVANGQDSCSRSGAANGPGKVVTEEQK